MLSTRLILRRGLGLGLCWLAMTFFVSSVSAQGGGAIGGGGGTGIGGGAGGGGAGGGGGLANTQQLGGLGQGQTNAFSGGGFTIGAGIGSTGSIGTLGPGNGYYATPRAAGFVTQPITSGRASVPGNTAFGTPISNIQAVNSTATLGGSGTGFAGGTGGTGFGGGTAGTVGTTFTGAGGTGFGGTGGATGRAGGAGLGGAGGITGLGGGVGGVGGLTTGATGTIPFGSSYGTRRAPPYITQLAFRYQPKEPAALRSDLQRIIQDSPRLRGRENMTVRVDGNSVVLNGVIRAQDRPDGERQKRLAEAIVRLTPGVRDVQNNLEIEIVGPSSGSGVVYP